MSRATDAWRRPPEHVTITYHQVHVWRASSDLAPEATEYLYGTLADNEKRQAMRYHFAKDRSRYIATHGLLRLVLSRYVMLPPRDLRFSTGAHGKPALATECGGERIMFNSSDSHGLSLYAVACQRRVGIDLEYVSKDLAREGIAEQFFSPLEVAELRSLPSELQNMGFYMCWTRKEAYLKALGAGLYLPLNHFSVSLTPGRPAALLTADGTPDQTTPWSVRSIHPGHGFVGAIVVEGHDWETVCYDWTDPFGIAHTL
jgi:4'-phosphopantetheinyl transferase